MECGILTYSTQDSARSAGECGDRLGSNDAFGGDMALPNGEVLGGEAEPATG